MSVSPTEASVAQWNHMPDIHDVRPLDANDHACLDAIRDVLERHGCLERFGVNLLHKHFEMAADEILVESADTQGRRLMTKPVKMASVAVELASAYETQWQWRQDASGHVAQICVARCFPGNPDSHGHVNKHVGW